MEVSATLAIGVAFLPNVAVAAGGFWHSCRSNWYIEGGHYMVAECRRVDGSYMRTRQDMNLCLANAHGNAVERDNGGFSNSCWGCQQGEGIITADEPPTSFITCICRTGEGNKETSSSFDLNTIVENRDGYMWCYNHRSAIH